MKELSIEEKAKRYDEAIERAKKVLLDCTPEEQKVVEYISPELKESEDERIRKALIKYLDALDDDEIRYGVSFKDMRTWLEKQSKASKVEQAMREVEEKAKAFTEAHKGETSEEILAHMRGEQKLTDKIEPIEGEFPYDNPADTLEGEIDNIWRNVSCYNRFSATKEGFEEVIRHFINFVRQNPARSEEDKEHIDTITSLLEYRKKEQTDWGVKVLDEEIAWLKSIKERVQPKQEWSEEEHQIIEDAACVILDCINTVETKKEEERLEELADKLQNLRPQLQWKPSDEQMKALWEVYKGGEEQTALASLWSDLKKLKRE